jgi:PAS domain S-box-containing protein
MLKGITKGIGYLLLTLFGLNAGSAETRLTSVTNQPKRVLVIHSYGRAAPPFTTQSTAFETALTQQMGERVDLDEVSLNVARYETLDMEQALVEFVRKRQARWQPDLVVPIGLPAGRFVARYRDRLFPRATPIIYTGVDQRHFPMSALEQNAVLVGLSFDIPGVVQDILQITPATTNIAVVIGSSALELFWKDTLQREWQPFTNRVSFTWFNDLSFDQMLERSSRLPPRSFLLIVILMRDAAGVTHNADEALEKIHQVANAPINGLFQHQLGLGIVGGRLFQSELVGKEAAGTAVRILHGEPTSSFPPKIVPTLSPRYDWRELQRWKIDQNRLPAGSPVLFQRPTVWQRNRAWIIPGLLVFILQAILILALLASLVKQRRAERKLVESETRFRMAADEAPVVIWMSGLDKLCTFVNKPWLEFTGRTIEQELGTGWTEALHPDDLERCLKIYVEAVDARRPFVMEYRLRRFDGEYRWFIDSGRPRLDAQGNIVGYIGSCADVTEQKWAELEIQQQRRQLEHVSRVSLVGELSASIAHELNQPLMATLANAQAARRYLAHSQPDLDEVRAILNDVVSDTIRAGEVIKHVRALVTKGNQEFREVNIDEVIRDVVSFLHSDIAARKVCVELELAPALPIIQGDPIQLQQVLVNLTLNAFDAVDALEIPKRRAIISAAPESHIGLRVSVRDCGAGIPPDKLEMVFRSYYTTKSGGMGFGLAMTRSIVEAHGGRIWAENQSKGGAVFHLVLPAANGTAVHSGS